MFVPQYLPQGHQHSCFFLEMDTKNFSFHVNTTILSKYQVSQLKYLRFDIGNKLHNTNMIAIWIICCLWSCVLSNFQKFLKKEDPTIFKKKIFIVYLIKLIKNYDCIIFPLFCFHNSQLTWECLKFNCCIFWIYDTSMSIEYWKTKKAI